VHDSDNHSGSRGRRPLMSIAEVAEVLGVSVRHVRRLVQERRIPFFKWGHLLRFDPDEIETWLKRSHVPAKGPLDDLRRRATG
jgi:excisionase family DNA binding protein